MGETPEALPVVSILALTMWPWGEQYFFLKLGTVDDVCTPLLKRLLMAIWQRSGNEHTPVAWTRKLITECLTAYCNKTSCTGQTQSNCICTMTYMKCVVKFGEDLTYTVCINAHTGGHRKQTGLRWSIPMLTIFQLPTLDITTKLLHLHCRFTVG